MPASTDSEISMQLVARLEGEGRGAGQGGCIETRAAAQGTECERAGVEAGGGTLAPRPLPRGVGAGAQRAKM
eukprot:CAMPEP_0172179088 /NCGR_PEP_ID=MMETSP1050-20130122/16412_1 /TAXON_ID=233186 /ORGANISM="Cryptomonas curvata, Strain CCAP979/52" /LENGTH=71 /DNA_ID=CAMNT_0012851909 /DNA_START=106 /DNA_END=321 /DNA_ORIENTATION=-